MFNIYPWQKKQWQFLLSMHHQNRLPQALLFKGVQGLAKRRFSELFSTYVLCDDLSKGEKPCGQCRSCELMRAGNHPDFYCVEPLEKSKLIKVDQVRDLTGQLEQTSHRDGHQVVIMHPAEMMNRSAANALLKTIEEPVGHVLIILVCDKTNTLPATILSRCQQLAFSANADQDNISWVQQQLNTEKVGEKRRDEAALLLGLADHAPQQALALMESGYLELRDQTLRHFLRMQKGEIDPIAPVADFLKKDVTLLMHAIMTLLMDLIRLQLGVKTEHLFHRDRIAQLQILCRSHNVMTLQNYFSSCQQVQSALQSSIHLNPQMLLESLFIKYNETK